MSRLISGKVREPGNVLADLYWLRWIRVVKEEYGI